MIFMMWYYGKTKLGDAISDAKIYADNKYGSNCTIVKVKKSQVKVKGITIIESSYVPKQYLYIGEINVKSNN